MKFWTRTTRPEIPNYSLVEDSADDIFNISILDGPLAGLVYRYGKVRFVEEAGLLRVKFNYTIIWNPTQSTQEEIESILSVILDDIIKKEHESLEPH